MKRIFTLMIAILIMVLIITGCSNDAPDSKEPVKIVVTDNGVYLACLKNAQWAVAPGQSLVVFDKELVLGGGIISVVE